MFTEQTKLTVLSIVSIFETSKPLGDYAACVVLNDGAGVSYGICQFTHRSGSLRQVVERYLDAGGTVGRTTLELALPWLMKRTPLAIKRLAASDQFKKALIAAAVSREMKEAQEAVAFERYLRPAVEICMARGFVMPLSLAVVYDSVVHGSFERIAGRVGSASGERAWVTAYVRERNRWLTSVARLKVTTYRTRFFLDQIAIGNWDLNLPINVHGCRLTSDAVRRVSVPGAVATGALEPNHSDGGSDSTDPAPFSAANGQTPRTPVATAPGTDTHAVVLNTAAERFDQLDNVVTTLTARTDRAKSLWTTVGGSVSQAAWAILGWLAGVPREVWIAVAVIAALLMLLYLYRQIVLGRIRETN